MKSELIFLAGVVCLACQSSPGEPETKVSAAIGSIPVSTAPGEWTPLLLHAPNHARCVLQQNGGQSLSPPLDSDDQGLIRFSVSSTINIADTPDMTLVCTSSETDETTTQTLKMSDVIAAQTSLQVSAAIPKVGSISRPPLEGDPTAISQPELIARGYPPRPDPITSPESYSGWLKHVSKAGTIIPAHLNPHRGRRNVTMANGVSHNWSGVVLSPAANPYVQVQAHYPVPAVVAGSLGYLGYSSIWVGLGGNGTGSLLQGGTVSDEWATYDEQCRCTVYYGSYYAWIEWYPNDEASIDDFAIYPGHVMYALAWIGDQSGNVDLTGHYAWLYLYDETDSVGTFASQGGPSGVAFDGSSAEWILERPTQCTWWFGEQCGQGGLVNYHFAYMYDARASTSDNVWSMTHNWSTNNSSLIQMINNSNQVLTQAGVTNNPAITFNYVRGQ